MLCVILGYIACVSVIYVRIVLVGFKRVLVGFRGTGHIEPLPTGVGRTLTTISWSHEKAMQYSKQKLLRHYHRPYDQGVKANEGVSP